MLDLETMSTKTNAAIIAIGAVRFDAEGVREKFYIPVTLASSIELGLKVDAGTIGWWMKQSDEARAVINDPDSVHLGSALVKFNEWLKSLRGHEDEILLWGNGSNFDNVILRSAYEAVGYPNGSPISPFNDRCYRTVKNANADILLERTGTHHNAVNDAESQANHLIAINAKN